MKKVLFFGNIILLFCFQATNANAQAKDKSKVHHPSYLHAMTDLRAARWLIEHTTEKSAKSTAEEIEAIKQIDAALVEIKKAAVDDGKDVKKHPAIDEHSNHKENLIKAGDLLAKARADIDKPEDNTAAIGLRDNAIKAIDAAIVALKKIK